jgi:hypothetical protein
MDMMVTFTFKKYRSGDSLTFKQKNGEWISLDELKAVIIHAIEQTDALIGKGDNLTISIQTTESEETTT